MSEHGVKCFDNKCAAVGDYCHLQCPDGTDIDCRMLVSAEWKQRAERAEAALRAAHNLVSPWSTYTDYRAEDDLQKACKIILEALGAGDDDAQ